LELEYRKVKASRKSLKLIVAMDARELRITTERAECLEKENVDFNTKLHSQANDSRKSIKTIERLQLSVQKLSCHAPITQE
jgi:hypothetical protein